MNDRIREQLQQPNGQLAESINKKLDAIGPNSAEITAAASGQEKGVSGSVRIGDDRASVAGAGGWTTMSGWWAAAKAKFRW